MAVLLRIGVFLCQCGPNIEENMDLDRVEETIAGEADVELVLQENFPCSPDGQQTIKEKIQSEDLTHCVFAACSHRDHEETFEEVLEEAGLNPYLMEMANVREQIAWVVEDEELATDKSIAQIRAAIAKVKTNEPLEDEEIEANPDVAIIGGGIAGIKAAKLAARDGRQVYLIDREASVGGKMPQWEESFPSMDCNPCFLAPEIKDLKATDNIEIVDSADVKDIVGFYGNFTIELEQEARGVLGTCMPCGECEDACPVDVVDDFDFGLSQRSAIYAPFPGSLPEEAKIDWENCLRSQGEDCTACEEACPMSAIDYSQEDQAREINAGAVVLATGFEPDSLEDKPNYSTELDNVLTSAQFERLVSSTGPTEAHLQKVDGEPPESITIVHCAGREGTCSRVCCAASLKYAKYISMEYPEIEVNIVHYDLCLAGEGYQGLYEDVRAAENVTFHRMSDYRDVRVSAGENEERIVSFKDSAGSPAEVSSEMVVHSVGMQPASGVDELVEMLSLETNEEGYIEKDHTRMAPNMAGVEGIYVAGCCGGPKDEQETVMNAEGVAGAITSKLKEGEKIPVETMTAYVDEDLCSACRRCISVCPYKAISYDEEDDVAEVNEVLCEGCGTCVAACPSGAMKNHHFETGALEKQLKALFK